VIEPGSLGEPLDLACGVCWVGVSDEDEAGFTDGRPYVFLTVRGETLGHRGVTAVAMTVAEARELARRLREAAVVAARGDQ
jgi:hypothetical protein